MKFISILIGLIFLIAVTPSYSEEPDFYINFDSCKTVAGYLVLSDESLKVMDGDPTTMACSRKSESLNCHFTFNDADRGKGNDVTYQLLLDSPPLLSFGTQNGSEYISVDTVQHAAVIITRIVDKKFTASKVCQGAYFTNFEVKNLGK